MANFLTKLFGNKSQRDLKVVRPFLEATLAVYPEIEKLATAKSGDVGLNPYYQTNYSYTWGSRAVTFGLTWRIGKMDLQSLAREGVSAPTL